MLGFVVLGTILGSIALVAAYLKGSPPIGSVLVFLIVAAAGFLALVGLVAWLGVRAERAGAATMARFAEASTHAESLDESDAARAVLDFIGRDPHASLAEATTPLPPDLADQLPADLRPIFERYEHIECVGVFLSRDEIGTSELAPGSVRVGRRDDAEIVALPDGWIAEIDPLEPEPPEDADPLTPWRWMLREIVFVEGQPPPAPGRAAPGDRKPAP